MQKTSRNAKIAKNAIDPGNAKKVASDVENAKNAKIAKNAEDAKNAKNAISPKIQKLGSPQKSKQ